jgi:hypothetical protein
MPLLWKSVYRDEWHLGICERKIGETLVTENRYDRLWEKKDLMN